MMRSVVFFNLVVLTLVCFSSSTFAVEQEIYKKVTRFAGAFSESLSLFIESDFASIEIIGTDSQEKECLVTIDYQGKKPALLTWNEKKELGKVQIKFDGPKVAQGDVHNLNFSGVTTGTMITTNNGITTKTIIKNGVAQTWINGVLQSSGSAEAAGPVAGKLTIEMPKKYLENLKVQTNLESILVKDLNNESNRMVVLKSSYGNVKGENLEASSVLLESSNGAVSLNNARAKKINIQSNYGKVSSSNTSGELNMTSSHESVEAQNHEGLAILKSTYGKIKGTHILGKVGATNSNADVTLKAIEGDVRAVSTYGKVVLDMIQGNAFAESSNADVKITGGAGGDTQQTLGRSTYGKVNISDRAGFIVGKSSNDNVVFNNPNSLSESGLTNFGKIKGQTKPSSEKAALLIQLPGVFDSCSAYLTPTPKIEF